MTNAVAPRPRQTVVADDAFSLYVVPEIPVMLRAATALTRNVADAEDVVQDALLAAYRAIDRFDGRHPRAWLLTIVRNTYLNRVRKRRPQLLNDPDATFATLADPSPRADVEASVTGLTMDEAVVTALEELPLRMRKVVELVDMGGLRYQEAADALGIPLGTVMSRLHRARRRMRDQLERAGVTPRPTQ